MTFYSNTAPPKFGRGKPKEAAKQKLIIGRYYESRAAMEKAIREEKK